MPAADGEDPKTLAEWSPPAAFDVQRFQKVLGEELRKLRRARGWTRKQLNAQISSEISLQTLGTYELGNRQCSVARLAELCVAMNELPQDLIARVHQRVFVDEPKQLRVDLRALAGAGDPRLVPLRRWAAGRLDQPQAREELLVEMAVVDQMADLCGLPPMELIVILHRLEG